MSGRNDNQNVVVGRINGVFLLKNVLVFCRAKKIGRNNAMAVLMRCSYGGVPL